MVRRYQIRLMRSVNARCVSIGLVLALSNCSESGGEPDAMLDMHHPGTGIDSHHPQFHNSYGNMKFIIIVINPNSRGSAFFPRSRARGASQVLAAFFAARFFSARISPPVPSFPATRVRRRNAPFHPDSTRQASFRFRTIANFLGEGTREVGGPTLKNLFPVSCHPPPPPSVHYY